MTDEMNHQGQGGAPAQPVRLLPERPPVRRTVEQKARILAHLLVQLADALNEKGKAGDGNA